VSDGDIDKALQTSQDERACVDSMPLIKITNGTEDIQMTLLHHSLN